MTVRTDHAWALGAAAVAALAASCLHGASAPARPPEPTAPVEPAPAPSPLPPPPIATTPPPLRGEPLVTYADIEAILAAPAEMDTRRFRFGLAVEGITALLGQPITAAAAIAAAPCGGWSGPGCSTFTYGVEAIKVAAPIAARLYDRSRDEVARVLVAAVSVHSVWHDAFGYVYCTTGLGPGYAYAGCTFGPCAPDNPQSGQIDGIIYQTSRLLGLSHGPECGPSCTLPPLW